MLAYKFREQKNSMQAYYFKSLKSARFRKILQIYVKSLKTHMLLKPCGFVLEELIQKLIYTSYALASTYTGSYHAVFVLAKPHFVEQLYRKPCAR